MLRHALSYGLFATAMIFAANVAVAQTSQAVDRSQILRIEPGTQVGASSLPDQALGYAAPSENEPVRTAANAKR